MSEINIPSQGRSFRCSRNLTLLEIPPEQNSVEPKDDNTKQCSKSLLKLMISRDISENVLKRRKPGVLLLEENRNVNTKAIHRDMTNSVNIYDFIKGAAASNNAKSAPVKTNESYDIRNCKADKRRVPYLSYEQNR